MTTDIRNNSFTDPIVIPFAITILDQHRQPKTGLSRRNRSAVLPANGWPAGDPSRASVYGGASGHQGKLPTPG